MKSGDQKTREEGENTRNKGEHRVMRGRELYSEEDYVLKTYVCIRTTAIGTFVATVTDGRYAEELAATQGANDVGLDEIVEATGHEGRKGKGAAGNS